MKLEDYFTFLAPDDIRLKGTRVGIETISGIKGIKQNELSCSSLFNNV